MLDSRASWARRGVLLLVGSIDGVGMWPAVATLPAVQAGFGAARAGAALPCTATMLGFAAGGWMAGAVFDRTGSHRLAFADGAAWNLVNDAAASLLAWRARMRRGGGVPSGSVSPAPPLILIPLRFLPDIEWPRWMRAYQQASTLTRAAELLHAGHVRADQPVTGVSRGHTE